MLFISTLMERFSILIPQVRTFGYDKRRNAQITYRKNLLVDENQLKDGRFGRRMGL